MDEVLDVTTVLMGGELALVERVEGDHGGVVDRVVLSAGDVLGGFLAEL